MYEYHGKVDRVIDGDTVVADVDLGFGVQMRMRLRLAAIDAPELPSDAGQAAKDHLSELIAKAQLDKPLIIRTRKDRADGFGRYIAFLCSGGICLNDLMVADKHAVYRTYSFQDE